ncbi:MAG TPA: 3-hydroxyacyl-CoA dehydrogenase family protein [Nitrososphaeraceae archaeon]|nr:3-hydroxyacyl-CoA dehydrogenase family protein [Nitrososphaeraceae archaeon]
MEKIANVTVLGSGTMGHGIAQIAAMAGFNVHLRDVEQRFLDSAMDKIRWSLDKLVEKNKMTKESFEQTLSRLVPVIDLKTGLKDADLVVEAVPEDLSLKRRVYKEVSSYADPKTLFASNTSTLPISEMADLTDRPESFIGLHFFNPPQLMKLVEVIQGHKTGQSTVERIMAFVEDLGKTPVLVQKDVAGFIVNRIFIPLVHEAVYCKDRDGVTYEEIDAAMKSRLGFPMGIFELADYTGLDVINKASQEMRLRDEKVIRPHPLIEKLFEEKKLGQKTGQGFYTYSSNKYERKDLVQADSKAFDPIVMLAVASNNAGWLLTNGVCSRPDLEKALRLGMGLKKELLATAQEFGIKQVIDKLNEMSEKYGNFYTPDPYLYKL